MPVTFTDRELDIMSVLWEHGPSTVADVHEHLRDEIAYKTVLTMLRLMESKGYVTHKEEGRAHRFAAKIGRDQAGRTAIDHMLDKIFGGSEELLLARLVQTRKLDTADIKRLRRVLDDRLSKDADR
jgi:predicted transcriptional regulator